MDEPMLIVGAGPVGLTLALALRRQGVALRIVDKAAGRTDKSKALVIWPRTLEQLDMQGIAPLFVAAGVRARGARILGEGQRELAHAHFDLARSAYPFALMIPQSETEALLEQQLAAAGVQVERQVELLYFSDDGRRVSALLRHADARQERVSTAWLAACDGAHSTVRHALFSTRKTVGVYDWGKAQARWSGDVKKSRRGRTIALQPGDMSGLLINLAIMRDTQPGKSLQYRFVDDSRMRVQQYAVAPATENVTIGDVGYDAYRIDRVQAGADRTTVWFTPEVPLPVRIHMQDGDDAALDLLLTQYKGI